MYLKMVPDIVPTKRLLSNFPADTLHAFRDRNLESSFVPEDSFLSHADTTNTKQQSEEEDSPEGFICTYIVLVSEIILKLSCEYSVMQKVFIQSFGQKYRFF